MNQGDLVKFTFAKDSIIFNKEKKWSYAILLERVAAPPNSW